MKKQIVNARIVTPEGILENGVLRFCDGIIEYLGAEAEADIPTVDADGAYLMAGFVDIHCHGGAGYDFMDATPEQMRKIAAFHLSHGTTTLLPTTMTDTWQAIYGVLDRYAALGEDTLTMVGVHLEGPWLSPAQCGAQDTSRMDTPSEEKLRLLMEKYPFIRRISAAPELDGGMAVGRLGRDLGLVMSVGHSDADFDTTVSAADNGYTMMTHLYSGMSVVHRKNAYRIAGAVEAALVDDRIFVELIADGCHLPAGLLKLVYKCKGAERIALVTDAMRGAGLADGQETMLGRMTDGVPCIIEDGVAKLPDRQSFAGSVATTDRLLRTMHTLAQIPLSECSKMLSQTPALILGLADRGSIEVGKRADFVLLDNELKIINTYMKGEENAS